MESRRVAHPAPRHALTDAQVDTDLDDGADLSEVSPPRHAARSSRFAQLRVLIVPVVVATVITGMVVAFKPAPTTVAEPLVQDASVTAPSQTAQAASSPAVAPSSAAASASASPSTSSAPAASAAPSGNATPEPTVTARASATSAAASASASPTVAAATSAAPASPKTSAAQAKSATTGTRYTTAAVNLRATASKSAKVLTTIGAGTTVQVTATTSNGFQQVVWKNTTGWVTAAYLSTKKPVAAAAAAGGGISAAPCKSGSSVEAGLVRNGIKVHRAVCAKFPFVKRYIGRGGGGHHAAGRALDIMVSGANGWAIANWLRANAASLGITEVIYSQRIWTTQRSREGWRGMSNRGSATANHYDHVHVTVR